MDCIFCEIVAGRLPASVVHDDEHVLAFMDINPATPGHLLVIPKRHATDLSELDPEDGRQVFAAGQRLGASLRASALDPAGINLFLADGEAAGQEVLHVHLHVLPRTPGDGFAIDATYTAPDRAELDAVARDIRSAVPEEPNTQRTRGQNAQVRRRSAVRSPRGASGAPGL